MYDWVAHLALVSRRPREVACMVTFSDAAAHQRVTGRSPVGDCVYYVSDFKGKIIEIPKQSIKEA